LLARCGFRDGRDLGESIHDGCQQIKQDLLIFNNKTVQGFLD